MIIVSSPVFARSCCFHIVVSIVVSVVVYASAVADVRAVRMRAVVPSSWAPRSVGGRDALAVSVLCIGGVIVVPVIVYAVSVVRDMLLVGSVTSTAPT